MLLFNLMFVKQVISDFLGCRNYTGPAPFHLGVGVVSWLRENAKCIDLYMSYQFITGPPIVDSTIEFKQAFILWTCNPYCVWYHVCSCNYKDAWYSKVFVATNKPKQINHIIPTIQTRTHLCHRLKPCETKLLSEPDILIACQTYDHMIYIYIQVFILRIYIYKYIFAHCIDLMPPQLTLKVDSS